MLVPAVVHAVFGLVVELDEVAFGEVETLEVRVGGADTEGDMGRVGDDGEVDPMGVMYPVARVVMRRDGDSWRHGREEATDDFVGGHTEGFEDGEEEGAPFGVVQPGHLKAASEEVIAIDKDNFADPPRVVAGTDHAHIALAGFFVLPELGAAFG